MKKTSTENKYMNSADRTNLILDVSCRLFAEKSYDAVSIREIAVACGCSPSLIMKNFKSKEAIYAALLDEWKAMCQEPLINEIPDGDACLALEKIFNLLVSGKDQRAHTYRPNLENAVASRVSFQSTIASIKKNLQDISTDIILPLVIRGQKEKNIKQGDPKEIADIIWFSIYGFRLVKGLFAKFKVAGFDFVKEMVL